MASEEVSLCINVRAKTVGAAYLDHTQGILYIMSDLVDVQMPETITKRAIFFFFFFKIQKNKIQKK